MTKPKCSGWVRQKNIGPIECSKPDISWVEGNVFALGVWFATDRNVVLSSNYDERIGKIKNDSETHLIGTENYSYQKSSGLPTHLYFDSAPYLYKRTSNGQQTSFEFLWDGKDNKIKREHIIRDYEQGGLRMIDIYIRSISLSKHPGSKSTLTRQIMEDGSFFSMTILKCMVRNLVSLVIYTKMTFHC